MYDPATQRPRGFGFITFDSEDAVEKVIQQNTFHQIHEKLVEVKKAVPKELTGVRTVTTGGYGGVRGVAYNNGYVQGSNITSANAYVGPRFAPPQGGRAGYPSYSAPTYGPIGYGGGPGYGVAMSGGYGANAYGGRGGFTQAGGYGSGYGAPPPSIGSPGVYVSAPQLGPRSPWGNSSSGYGVVGVAGYGGPGWNSGPATQSNGSGSGYKSGGGFRPRNMANGVDSYATGLQSHYGGTVPWKSGDTHASPASASGGGYGNVMGASPTDATTGYGVVGRQTQRGPDARFRPYPSTAGERAS